jgi:hypothetical protein
MRRRYRKPTVRTIVVKYEGQCACCGASIKAGETADFYPIGTIASMTTAAIAHVGGLDGNSARCTAEIRKRQDPGFVDIDRMYEDQCSDICGR